MLLEKRAAQMRDHVVRGCRPDSARQLRRPARSPPARGRAARGRRAAARAGGCAWTWQIATASASAASCGVGTVGEAEQQLHHLLHLRLLGAAVADDGALDLGRRVLDDRQPGLDRREHRDAARVPQLQRAARRCRRGRGSRWRRSRAGTRASSAASRRWMTSSLSGNDAAAGVVMAPHAPADGATRRSRRSRSRCAPSRDRSRRSLTRARPRSPSPRCRSSTRRAARRRGPRGLPSA